jgi:hypothetical protein
MYINALSTGAVERDVVERGVNIGCKRQFKMEVSLKVDEH